MRQSILDKPDIEGVVTSEDVEAALAAELAGEPLYTSCLVAQVLKRVTGETFWCGKSTAYKSETVDIPGSDQYHFQFGSAPISVYDDAIRAFHKGERSIDQCRADIRRCIGDPIQLVKDKRSSL